MMLVVMKGVAVILTKDFGEILGSRCIEQSQMCYRK